MDNNEDLYVFIVEERDKILLFLWSLLSFEYYENLFLNDETGKFIGRGKFVKL